MTRTDNKGGAVLTMTGPTRVVCAAGVLMLVAGCAIVPVTGRHQLSLVPQSDLIGMAAQDYEQFVAESTVSADAGARNMVAEVGGRVAGAASEFMREYGMDYELSHYVWEFQLIEDEAANAFCMPGGKIVVFSGIMPLTETDEGLAVVVAHEVAHAVANHGGERMSQLLLAQLGGMALSKAIEEKPEQTREADRIGLLLMARAGYDPRQALQFWQRMAAQSEGQPPEFLSTHPSHATRIEDIRSHMPEAVAIYEEQ